ncbi:MAG: hypothetical protein C0167_01455 [Nitrososphaera sp.]|nr:MAG: hypothetical protein C0167_01455 [Nitrososphaera sp.]
MAQQEVSIDDTIEALSKEVMEIAKKIMWQVYEEKDAYIKGRLHSIANMLVSASAELNCVSMQKKDQKVMC